MNDNLEIPVGRTSKERYGILNYTLVVSENTGPFIEGIIQKCHQRQTELLSQGEENIPMARIVAKVLAEEVSSGVYFPRLLVGGKYHPEDVVKNVSCFDISFMAQLVLEGLGIKSQGEKTSLLMIPKHYYTVTEDKEVIDLFVRGKKYPDGYFKSIEEYKERLRHVNSLGVAGLGKQAKKMALGDRKEDLIARIEQREKKGA